MTSLGNFSPSGYADNDKGYTGAKPAETAVGVLPLLLLDASLKWIESRKSLNGFNAPRDNVSTSCGNTCENRIAELQ
ncbi:hypothetical protein KQX54_016423 [Cotesia glomerata]|uniref:Uncharacterized protein n=1 Tax=Cotesia glomerata TaxID=32391 RepID=A0AAV7HU63_COTGL|nr:hypothetical protein KQX54_016423 [Cotesia glomerata]